MTKIIDNNVILYGDESIYVPQRDVCWVRLGDGEGNVVIKEFTPIEYNNSLQKLDLV